MVPACSLQIVVGLGWLGSSALMVFFTWLMAQWDGVAGCRLP